MPAVTYNSLTTALALTGYSTSWKKASRLAAGRAA
jgi:hypothetical protein